MFINIFRPHLNGCLLCSHSFFCQTKANFGTQNHPQMVANFASQNSLLISGQNCIFSWPSSFQVLYKNISSIEMTQHFKSLLLLNCCYILFHDICYTFNFARNDNSSIFLENNDTVTINKVISAIILNEKRRSLHVNTTLSPPHDGPFSTY